MYREGLLFKNLPLTALIIGTFAVLLFLPYTQGLRYLLNILPLLLMFAALGGIYLWNWLSEKWSIKYKQTILQTVSLFLILLLFSSQLINGISNLRNDRQPDWNDVYADDCIEMYHYVQKQIPEGAQIGFAKPRALYLNTGRVSMRLGYNDHTLEDVDYYLFCTTMYEPYDWEIVNKQQQNLQLIWSNQKFLLYEVVLQ